MSSIEQAIERIRSVGEEYRENQAYIFPEYDPVEADATALCERLGIPFTDDIMIRYPANRTFVPIDRAVIEQQEALLGFTLPLDYKTLLQTLGEVHIPGHASVCINSPENALQYTREAWFHKGDSLTVLAIASYHDTADGDSIGFVAEGNSFPPAVYQFEHGLREFGDDPNLWSTKIADSLADFLIAYLNGI